MELVSIEFASDIQFGLNGIEHVHRYEGCTIGELALWPESKLKKNSV